VLGSEAEEHLFYSSACYKASRIGGFVSFVGMSPAAANHQPGSVFDSFKP
jgi:hypothetical protein